MANAVKCACGWDVRGTEENIVDALARHVAEVHEKKTSGDSTASEVEEGCGC